jgi:hypothetical protein
MVQGLPYVDIQASRLFAYCFAAFRYHQVSASGHAPDRLELSAIDPQDVRLSGSTEHGADAERVGGPQVSRKGGQHDSISPSLSFFRYCYLNFSPERHSRQDEDLFEHKPKPNSMRIGADGVEIEIIHEYSWRNFFYSINFIRVVHQLTKRRPARISLLVQYKSSVSLDTKHPDPFTDSSARSKS